MRLLENVKMALQQVRVNRLRSVLTLLGIVVGVSTVITMVTLVEGFRIYERDLFIRWGNNLVELFPPRDEARQTRSLVNGDVEILKAECPAFVELSGIIYVDGITVRHGGGQITAMLTACAPSYMEVADLIVVAGRAFTDSEMRANAMVCVLGADAAQELVADALATDQTVEAHVGTHPVRLRVVGVTKETGHHHDLDKVLYIPLSTMQRRILGCGDRIQQIKGEAATLDGTEQAANQAKRAAKLHGIPIDTWTLKGQFEKDARLCRNLDLLFGGTGVIIILVSGLGLMNLMLVSLAQRRWEVGLRKALGATDRDVVVQFLTEAASVSLLGGIAALPVALIGAWAAVSYLNFPLRISPALVVATEAAVIGIGVAAGVVPARRAAKLLPQDTLREV